MPGTHQDPAPDRPPSSGEIVAAWQRELPGSRTDSIEVLTPLWRAAQLLSGERERTLRRLGIDESTLDLLSTLRRAGAPYRLTTRQITARSMVTAGAVSQRLARAEAAGLITRAPTTESRRGVLVSLTPRGHRRIEQVVRALLDHEATLTDRLTEDQRAAFTAALTTLTSGIRSG